MRAAQPLQKQVGDLPVQSRHHEHLARERLAAPLPRRLLEDVREREIQLRGRGYKHAQPQLLREDADGERLLRIGLKQQHGRSHAIFLL